jgi:hypothetical protein
LPDHQYFIILKNERTLRKKEGKNIKGAVMPPATDEIANTGVITIRFHGRNIKNSSVYL